jgi:hypothetical protein
MSECARLASLDNCVRDDFDNVHGMSFSHVDRLNIADSDGGDQKVRGPTFAGPRRSLLLLAFGMGLFAVLASHLRMLLGVCGMLLALGMIALAMMLGSERWDFAAFS